MSRIVLESKSPTWQKSDLRMTRVKDTDRGELLIFKELSWQTVRIEAKSTMSEDLTPLRLITNQARCRITIKKKLSGITVSQKIKKSPRQNQFHGIFLNFFFVKSIFFTK